MERISRLHRYEDAPSKLTDEQFGDVNRDPVLVSLIEKRNACTRAIRKKYKSRRFARNTKINAEYKFYTKKIASLRYRLRRNRLKEKRIKFHKNVHAKEVSCQLKGEEPLSIIALKISYKLPEN